jgi:acyl carrier protein
MSDPKVTIKNFIIENFLFGNADSLNGDTSFLEEGIIDSTGVLELITFLEEEFKIKVDDEELIPENLDSINNVAAFLGIKLKNAKSIASLESNIQ